MAHALAKIFGTEEDKVNCPFYLKMGACRHGERCSRIHNRPVLSQTLLLQNMYQPLPEHFDAAGNPIPRRDEEVQEHFEDFYEDIFEELTTTGGELEQLRVCENKSDHLAGNVYAKFREEDDAARALKKLVGRFYDGRPVLAQFSPVTDFKDARCRQYEEGKCTRGGYCNFMHLKKVSPQLQRHLLRLIEKQRKARARERDDRRRDRDDREYGQRERDGDGYDYGRRARDVDDYGRRRREPDMPRERESAQPPAREGSEERRSRFAAYAQARAGGSGSGVDKAPVPPPARESSEERRARIAKWVEEREAKASNS